MSYGPLKAQRTVAKGQVTRINNLFEANSDNQEDEVLYQNYLDKLDKAMMAYDDAQDKIELLPDYQSFDKENR